MHFTNSLNHWTQRHCDNITFIETTWENLVIMTSKLPAVCSCIDGVTLRQQFLKHREQWRDKCWIMSLKSQESQRCIEYTVPKILGRHCSMSARHIGVRGDIFEIIYKISSEPGGCWKLTRVLQLPLVHFRRFVSLPQPTRSRHSNCVFDTLWCGTDVLHNWLLAMLLKSERCGSIPV